MRCQKGLSVGVVSVCLLGTVTLTPHGQEAEPTSADVFDDRVVHELRLSMHAADWSRLQARYLENTFYPADLSWDGHVIRNVGVRSRGSGSRDPHKPGLRVTFDEYVSDQTFAGLKGLALDNFRQDPSMVKESVSMALFTRLGLVAPRVAHARLYVNGEYWGVYGVIEPIDKRFLRRTIGEDRGYLYEFEWSGAYHFEWLGADPARYAQMFEAETREDEPPPQLFSTLIQMIQATTRESTHRWEATMGRYFDFQHLLTYAAVESFLSDHDGLAGDWGSNNFYLYRFADSDRFQFLPWDKDVNFREIDRDVFAGVEDHHLLRTAMEFPRLQQIYREALRRCAAVASATDGHADGWLVREVARHANQVRASVHADTRKAFSNDRFEQEVAWMLAFARQRSGQIERQIGR